MTGALLLLQSVTVNVQADLWMIDHLLHTMIVDLYLLIIIVALLFQAVVIMQTDKQDPFLQMITVLLVLLLLLIVPGRSILLAEHPHRLWMIVVHKLQGVHLLDQGLHLQLLLQVTFDLQFQIGLLLIGLHVLTFLLKTESAVLHRACRIV